MLKVITAKHHIDHCQLLQNHDCTHCPGDNCGSLCRDYHIRYTDKGWNHDKFFFKIFTK